MSGMSKSTLDRTDRTRVLVVDDDANVRFLLTREISNRGHEVVEAADGAQAMEEMGRGDFDIVLTDIGMPGMDGLELAGWIKRTRPDTDVIVMTGYATIESAATAVRLGAFDYLLKNFGVMDLVTSSVDRAIQKRTLQTKLKENLEGLRKSEERFRLLVERITDGIIVVDRNGIVRFANPAAKALFNGKAKELLGEAFSFPVVADETTELDINRGDGEKAVAEMRVVKTEWEDELAYLASLRDITDSRRAQEQLKQSHTELKESHEELKTTQLKLIQAEKLESIGTLAAGVAHEVKNPLGIILMGIEYLSKYYVDCDEETATLLEDMDNAARRADSVIKGLLDFSSSSKLRMNNEDLNSVMEQSLLLVKFELGRQHVTLAKEFSEDPCVVRLDKNQIEQVLVNIFINAIHAMPDGGKLTVRTYAKQLTEVGHNEGFRKTAHFRTGETVVVAEIEDTGTGIPEDQLTKIFDPFFTNKSNGEGTGLGLTVTSKIIELHAGVIDITNRKEGGVKVTLIFKAESRQ
jgi:signal transduction histidine kinase